MLSKFGFYYGNYLTEFLFPLALLHNNTNRRAILEKYTHFTMIWILLTMLYIEISSFLASNFDLKMYLFWIYSDIEFYYLPFWFVWFLPIKLLCSFISAYEYSTQLPNPSYSLNRMTLITLIVLFLLNSWLVPVMDLIIALFL